MHKKGVPVKLPCLVNLSQRNTIKKSSTLPNLFSYSFVCLFIHKYHLSNRNSIQHCRHSTEREKSGYHTAGVLVGVWWGGTNWIEWWDSNCGPLKEWTQGNNLQGTALGWQAQHRVGRQRSSKHISPEFLQNTNRINRTGTSQKTEAVGRWVSLV